MNNNVNRFISNKIQSEDGSINQINTVRPQFLEDFVGQQNLKDNLRIFINSAKWRNEALDHVILYGPPGLGKTTLAQIIANELQVNIKYTSGPVLMKTGDLAALLTNLQSNDVLFIDEIHRLNKSVEEFLYSAMEDFAIDLIIGDGPAARTVRINLPKFTLIGATTRLGLLTRPLQDRFGIPARLDFYNSQELKEVILKCAPKLGIIINDDAAIEMAKRSRGTPRIAIRLTRRARDFSYFHNSSYSESQISTVLHLTSTKLNLKQVQNDLISTERIEQTEQDNSDDSIIQDNNDNTIQNNKHYANDTKSVKSKTATYATETEFNKSNIEEGIKYITLQIAYSTLLNLGIDEFGLDQLDRKYLLYIYTNCNSGPVGIDTIVSGLSEDKTTIEDSIEPFLIQIGFIMRTHRGRVLTDACVHYLCNIS